MRVPAEWRATEKTEKRAPASCFAFQGESQSPSLMLSFPVHPNTWMWPLEKDLIPTVHTNVNVVAHFRRSFMFGLTYLCI